MNPRRNNSKESENPLCKSSSFTDVLPITTGSLEINDGWEELEMNINFIKKHLQKNPKLKS